MSGKSETPYLGSIFLCLTLGTVFFFRLKSVKGIKNDCKEASIQQYVNRLTEFFDSDQLQVVKKEFLDMIDYGFYPKNAFKMVTFDGELN